MKRLIILKMALLMILSFMAVNISAEIVNYDRDVNYSRFIKQDRYLDVEIWTDDEEYYQGDNIEISFRADRDCFVAIYNIDTQGRVHILFPADEYDDNRIEGDRIYSIPGNFDDYELTVQGPPGIEHVQIIASKKPFDIPDWFYRSELICNDDPYDFMDYINATYFGGDRDIRRAYDMTSFYVEEWHQYYFRPVYVDHYHHNHGWNDWGFYGSVYVDYPFGATIYIDGVYWGIAPLFIPRIYYGWHYVTVYDHYGYCWEDRVEIVKRKSIALNETTIKTRSNVKSRFKEVRSKGYLNPAKNGYPKFKSDTKAKKAYKPITKTAKIQKNNVIDDSKFRVSKSSRHKTTKSTAKSSGPAYKGKRTGKTNETGKRTYKSTKSTKSNKKTYDTHKSSSKKSSGSIKKSTKSSGSSKSSGTSKSYKKSTKSSGSSKSSGTSKSYKKSTKSSGGSSSKKSTSSSKKSSKSSSSSSSIKKSSSSTTSSKSVSSSSSGGTKSSSGKRRK